MIESLNELAYRKPRRTGVRVGVASVCVAADAVLVYILSRHSGPRSSTFSSVLNLPLLPGYFIVARLAAWGIHGPLLRAIALGGNAALYSWLACGMPRDTWRASNLHKPTKTLDI